MSKSHYKIFLLTAFSCLTQYIFCQQYIEPELNTIQGRFFNYSISVPGADMSTTCLYFDRKGFLWQGSLSGLHRFDGMEYKSFYTNYPDSSGPAGNRITDMCEDTTGYLWITTFGALNRLDQKKWTFRHFSPDTVNLLNPSNRLYRIIEDRKGLLWLITGSDIFTFNKNTETFRRYQIDSLSYRNEIKPARLPGQILEDSSGRIWITSNYGLYKYDSNLDSLIAFRNIPGDNSSLQSNRITYIAEDNTGKIWCSTNGGGLHEIIDPEKCIFRKSNLHVRKEYTGRFDTLYSILPDSKGQIWTFGLRTVSCYNPADGKSETFLLPPPLNYIPGNGNREMEIRFPFEDRNGDIWFLYTGEGFMFRMNPTTQKIILYKVPSYVVYDCIMDGTGSFWFGCILNNSHRLVLDHLPFQVTDINNDFLTFHARSERIVEYGGSILFGTNSGIYSADSISFSHGIKLKQLGQKQATSFLKDHDGRLWIGFNNISLDAATENSSVVKQYPFPASEYRDWVFKMIEDHNKDLWIFTYSSHQIYILPHGEESIKKFTSYDDKLNKSLSAGFNDVLLDKNKRLWFGPQFGNEVCVYDLVNNITRCYGSASGLNLPFGDNCMGLSEDSKGRIWLLFLLNGLYMYDPDTELFTKTELKEDFGGKSEYQDIYVDRGDHIRISHSNGFTFYYPEVGSTTHIRFKQKIGQSAFFRPENGPLIYTIGNQLLVFPDSIQPNDNIPVVYLTSVHVNNNDYLDIDPGAEETSKIEKINLKYFQNNIGFSFTSLNYLYPEFNRYRYFMAGIDKDTVLTSADYRFAEYKDMRPGRYTFWFTGSNNDGVWNPSGKKVQISISAPWYGSVIAYFIYILTVLSIIIGLTRIRMARLRNEKIRLEGLVKQRTIDLEEKNKQILEMDNLKTRFFTEISHEIRTPLSLIVGPIENLLMENDREDEERRKKWLEMVRRNGRRLMKLVDQLLDLSRLDAGKMKIILVEADILNCIRILVYEYLSLAERRNIKYTIDIPDGSFLTFFDQDKIEKITSNLLSNAFKFTPSWGMVSCSAGIIKPESGKPAFISLSVRDTGKGISSENIEKIFDRFYRVEGQWEKDGSGAGIGLSLSNEYVKLLHGEIRVSSQPGAGSLFEIIIPLGKDHFKPNEYFIAGSVREDAPETIPNEKHYQEEAEGETEDHEKEIRLLVIEDNSDLRSFIRVNLSSEYTIYEADNGKRGLEIALEMIPDLIVTDVIMPAPGGIELCAVIKNDERTSHIPVIMLTAKTTIDDKIEGLRSGADDYIYKPFDIKELKVRISNLLIQRAKLRIHFGSLTGLEHPSGQHDSIDERFMGKVSSIILANLKDFDFDVGMLQEKVGMSRVHLFRKIKAITGLSPSVMIRNFRMKQAAELISKRSVSLASVSMAVGFSNPSYFSKCFRDFYGLTPKEYLEKKSSELSAQGSGPAKKI